MIENFNKIINNKSFEIVCSAAVIQRKNFSNEVVHSQNLRGLTFAHLTFLDFNFIDIDFRYSIVLLFLATSQTLILLRHYFLALS